jgi:hypothetical protein
VNRIYIYFFEKQDFIKAPNKAKKDMNKKYCSRGGNTEAHYKKELSKTGYN